MFRLMVADVDSPSYFIATAAAELGFFKEEGIDVAFEIAYGAESGVQRLQQGTLDLFAGPAFAVTRGLATKSSKLICALSQYSYWFLAVRADLVVRRGDVSALKGLRISASMPWPALALRYLLSESDLDLERDGIRIVPAPTTNGGEHWKAHAGADAIAAGLADAYWGNGMRVAIGERLGVAKLHLDLRRGDGPPGARWHNFAALMTAQRLIDEQPEAAAAAVRAIVKTQAALRADPSLATEIGNRLFPSDQASLITSLITQDAPFYDARISPEAIEGLNRFAGASRLLSTPASYEQLVATRFRHLWQP